MRRTGSRTTAAFEEVVAPHVDRRWAETFILELRLRGVAGADIGAALAEVESHCAESGASATDSVGPPIDYARSLPLPTAPQQGARSTLLGALPTLVQLLGMMLVLPAVPALVEGGGVPLRLGMLLSAAVLAVTVVALGRWPEPVLRVIVHRPWLAWGLATIVIGAVVVPVALLRQELMTLPATVIGVAGLVLLGAGVLAEVGMLRRRRAAEGQDVLAGPLELPGIVSGRSRRAAMLESALVLLIPVATVVAGALIAVGLAFT